MLLIFDLDGTLFEAKPVFVQAVKLLLLELHGSAPDDAVLLSYAGKSIDSLLEDYPPKTEEVKTRAIARYPDLISAVIKQSGTLFPGVRETLLELKSEGHTLAIVSRSADQYIRDVLSVAGIAPLFSYVLSAQNRTKTELVAELAKTADRATVIGDTYSDIDAAVKNKLPSIAVMYGYGRKDRLITATAQANSAYEIISCVKSLS